MRTNHNNMTISEVITKALFGKIVKADVEFYNSIICQTESSKDEMVEISSIELLDTGENTIRGIIWNGDNKGKECNFNFSLEKEFEFYH